MKQNLKQNLVTGGGKVGTILADYALEFNGTDEYLSIALPNNELLASAGVTDFYSSGSAIAGWTETGTGTVNWASGVSGKTYTETITLDSDSGISKTIIGLIVGQKYKLKIRCQTGYEGLCFGTALGESQYDTLIAPSGEWNTVSKVFTAESTELFFSTLSTSAIIDYASVKRDQGLDLNKDQEQILHSGDATFNNFTTRWVAKDGSSNQQCTLSTVDKSEGTGSLLITATGAGDATDHHVLLPSANIESVVSGKKYTLEGFVRLDASSLTYGSNLVAGWDFTSGWSFGASIIIDSNSYTGSGVWKTLCTVGKVYKLVFSASATIGTTEVYNMAGNDQNRVANGNGTFYFTAVHPSLYIRNNNGTGQTDVTTFELYEATPITLTAQLGTKSVTSSALSIVAGTFTKFVLNFEATASEQSQDLKLYLSGAGSVYVDKLSLTQAYDMWIVNKTKINDDGNFSIFNKANILGSTTNSVGIGIWGNTTHIYFDVFAGDNTSGTERGYLRTTFPNGAWANIGFKIDHTSGLSFGNNGSLTTFNFATIGKIIENSNAFTIGKYTTWFFGGQISHIQIWRFENISQSTFNSAITGLQYPTGGGSEEVLRVTFQDGSSIVNCLKDYSPKAHTVSGTNVGIENRFKVLPYDEIHLMDDSNNYLSDDLGRILIGDI